MGGTVTADSRMTHASVFLGSLTRSCLEETQEQQMAVPLVRSEPIGSLEAVWLHKFRLDSTWESQPSVLHISSTSLHLQQ